MERPLDQSAGYVGETAQGTKLIDMKKREVFWESGPKHKSWILPRKQLLGSKNVSFFILAPVILFALERIRDCGNRIISAK